MRCDACGRNLETLGPTPVTPAARWCRCDDAPLRQRPADDPVQRPPARVADELRERLLAVFG
jgi:hypothetical protein